MNGDSDILEYWPAIVVGVAAFLGFDKRAWAQRALLGVVFAVIAIAAMGFWVSWCSIKARFSLVPLPYLDSLVALPAIGAIMAMFLPSTKEALRKVALWIMTATSVASLWLLIVPMTSGWKYVSVLPAPPLFLRTHHLAIDGISLWFVLLATVITPIAAYVTFARIQSRIKELCVLLLLMESAAIGAFVSLDLVVFWVLLEVLSVALFILIGIFGQKDKSNTATKCYLLQAVGSALLILVIVYLGSVFSYHSNDISYDLLDLNKLILRENAQHLCFWAITIALFFKLPMVPFHTWLPDVTERAPIGVSVFIHAVYLNLAAYAFMRFGIGLFPAAFGTHVATLGGIAVVGGCIYSTICAWKQDNIKRFIAYMSMAQIGIVMLGLCANTQSTTQGALFHMVSRGIITATMILLVGIIVDRAGTSDISKLGGLAKPMPRFAACMLIVALAAAGLPSTSGFVGNFTVIMGAGSSTYLGRYNWLDAVLAAFGVVMAGAMAVGVAHKVLFGPAKNTNHTAISDMSTREFRVIGPLIASIFLFGLLPSAFFAKTNQSISDFHTRNRLVWMKAQDTAPHATRLLTNEFLAGTRPGSPTSFMLELLYKMDEGRPSRPQQDSEDLLESGESE
ncbi:MAG: NADH-quinone oxidoreductase subunit M [Polyangiaceae bacterium]|nr:NADH-quinone oxidoreductase subunit M [Polyangiaceae bacterium]